MTNPSKKPSGLDRRALLSTAAMAIPAAALSPMAALAAPEPDPIWAVIDEYRAAAAVLSAAEDDYSARDKRLKSELGKMTPSISVGVMRFHGPTPPSQPQTVYNVEQLDGLVPPGQFPIINARYRADLEAQQREHDGIMGGADQASAEAYDAAQVALHNALTVVPTTMPGVLALLAFMVEVRNDRGSFLDDDIMLDAIDTVSEALRDLTAAA
jgi:hypothetical protein